MLQASFKCLELEQPDSQEGAEEEDAGKRARYRNGYIITWMLHQILVISNKVKNVAG